MISKLNMNSVGPATTMSCALPWPLISWSTGIRRRHGATCMAESSGTGSVSVITCERMPRAGLHRDPVAGQQDGCPPSAISAIIEPVSPRREQGCSEIRWLAEKMGARPETVSGLSGLGDIMLTCYGALSRNRSVGVRLGRGEPLSQIIASSSQARPNPKPCAKLYAASALNLR